MADPLTERLVNDPASREAREWLRSGDGNTLGELESTEKSLAIVDEAYSAGAIKVLAVEIDDYPEAQNSGKLVIELPTASANRAAVFAWASEIAATHGFDGEADEGQTHLFVMLD